LTWQQRCMQYQTLEKDWLIDYLLFYVPLKNFLLIWRRHHYRWRAAKFRPMLGDQGLWAGRDLYCATPTVTRASVFPLSSEGLSLFRRILRHTRGCGEPILTRILTCPHSVASYGTQGYAEDLILPESSWVKVKEKQDTETHFLRLLECIWLMKLGTLNKSSYNNVCREHIKFCTYVQYMINIRIWNSLYYWAYNVFKFINGGMFDG
jgi:hypothetical protein